MNSLFRSVLDDPLLFGFLLVIVIIYVLNLFSSAKFYRTLTAQIAETNRLLAGQEAKLKFLSEAILSLKEAVSSNADTSDGGEEKRW